jgi:hypothetical protein
MFSPNDNDEKHQFRKDAWIVYLPVEAAAPGAQLEMDCYTNHLAMVLKYRGESFGFLG